MTYNKYGQPREVQDGVLLNNSGDHAFDRLNCYDDLRRLTTVEEGQLDTGSIVSYSRLEQLTRNLAGLPTHDQVDLHGSFVYNVGPPNAVDAGEMDDTRTPNKRNEVRSRAVKDSDDPSSPRTVTLGYDLKGNLIDDGEKYKYVYNPFGQLVQVTDQFDTVLAVYTYNGLGQRISEQLDANDSGNSGMPDGVADGHDPVFYIAPDLQGRRVATYRDADNYPKETFLWNSQGTLILRDRNDSLVDPTLWALETASDTRSQRHYYCSDFRGDVVAVLRLGEKGGEIAEQYRYSATGIPYGIPAGDFSGDGTVDYMFISGYDDGIWGAITTGYYGTYYQVRGDLNLDGYVDSADESIGLANDGTQVGRGHLSAPTVDSHCGYRNMEAFGEGFGIIWGSNKKATHAGLGKRISAAPLHLDDPADHDEIAQCLQTCAACLGFDTDLMAPADDELSILAARACLASLEKPNPSSAPCLAFLIWYVYNRISHIQACADCWDCITTTIGLVPRNPGPIGTQPPGDTFTPPQPWLDPFKPGCPWRDYIKYGFTIPGADAPWSDPMFKPGDLCKCVETLNWNTQVCSKCAFNFSKDNDFEMCLARTDGIYKACVATCEALRPKRVPGLGPCDPKPAPDPLFPSDKPIARSIRSTTKCSSCN